MASVTHTERERAAVREDGPVITPFLTNTVDPLAICGHCCDTFKSIVCQILAPMYFTRDCTLDSMRPGIPVVIPTVTSQATVKKNITTGYVADNSTIGKVVVTPNHLSVTFGISEAECQQGFRIQNLAAANARVLANGIWAEVMALVKNSANPLLGFPVANVVVSALASFTPATLGSLYGKLVCTPKHLLLDPVAMGALFFTAGGCCMPFGGQGAAAFGFQSISEHSVWTGADANTYGFGYCPDAIALVAGLPLKCSPCDSQLIVETFVIPGIGLPVQYTQWCNPSTREVNATFEVMFGAAILAPCAGVLLKSA